MPAGLPGAGPAARARPAPSAAGVAEAPRPVRARPPAAVPGAAVPGAAWEPVLLWERWPRGSPSPRRAPRGRASRLPGDAPRPAAT